jgi:predicted lipid-binding transport protein (Tim44 family)
LPNLIARDGHRGDAGHDKHQAEREVWRHGFAEQQHRQADADRDAQVALRVRGERAEALQASTDRERALAAIKSRDPQFDEQQFLARVSQAFLKIQAAWSRQDLSAVRPFISDGIRERFSFQFNMQQALGYRNQLDNVAVCAAQAAVVVADSQFDTIHVEFRATADDYRVDVLTGRRVGSPSVAQEFVEYWSFHRRPGAQTLARAGSIEGHCPHCGAPIEIVDRAQCSSCRSVVNSGEHDWVLAEITQPEEWREHCREAGIDGVELT